MVKDYQICDNNNLNIINQNNKIKQKNYFFIREDILRDFEEYKNEQKMKHLKGNFPTNIKYKANHSNERSFFNKTGTHGDAKSFDGLSSSLNTHTNNHNINHINKDVLLHDLLESIMINFILI